MSVLALDTTSLEKRLTESFSQTAATREELGYHILGNEGPS